MQTLLAALVRVGNGCCGSKSVSVVLVGATPAVLAAVTVTHPRASRPTQPALNANCTFVVSYLRSVPFTPGGPTSGTPVPEAGFSQRPPMSGLLHFVVLEGPHSRHKYQRSLCKTKTIPRSIHADNVALSKRCRSCLSPKVSKR